MRFEYAAIIAAAADTGEAVAVFRPIIQIWIHGPRGSALLEALVDTGADNTVFPLSVARDLGIPTIPATGPATQAFGGQKIAMSYADVELELLNSSTRLRWLAHVYFAQDDEREDVALLGREGFLDNPNCSRIASSTKVSGVVARSRALCMTAFSRPGVSLTVIDHLSIPDCQLVTYRFIMDNVC